MSSAARAFSAAVIRLARLHGVATSYIDASGIKRDADPRAIAAVLAGLGSPADTADQAAASEKARIQSITSRLIEPVTPVWIGKAASVEVAAEALGRGAGRFTIALEDGGEIGGAVEASSLKKTTSKSFEGVSRSIIRFPVPRKLPAGYHTLRIEGARGPLETLLIVSPRKAFRHDTGRAAGAWGVFCPLYALRAERNMGVGDLTDLETLTRWSAELGGNVVATLPMLAAFLGDRPGPFDPSPYNPVSRLFWNELFLDPTRLPEFAACAEAKRLVSSSGFKREAAALRALDKVDYRRAAALKRRVLEALAEHFFAGGGDRSPELAAFEKAVPLARDYSIFRAMTEKQEADWGAWPVPLRTARPSSKDYDQRIANYHLYIQFSMERQLAQFAHDVRSRGGVVYLDLPVGVSPFGFDVYRWNKLFAQGCSTGAPPDPYFTGGQDWGFPPLHPDAIRADRYAYFIACVRNHMRHSDYLRLDHVMAFYRLFFVPTGMGASHGLYVHYRVEEFFAILCLESHRNRCRLVGENLGTVPPIVNKMLAEHDLCALYVGQYEMQPRKPALRPVPANCVASANTHDMPPVATTLSGKDIDDRIGLGLLAKDKRAAERAAREKSKAALIALLRQKKLLAPGKTDSASIRDGLLAFMASGDADFMLINLEDMWLETRWQNVPGTMTEHANWVHKFRLSLEEIATDSRLAKALSRIDGIRKPAAAKGSKAKSARPAAIKPAKPRRRREPALV